MTDKLAILVKRLGAATSNGTVDWKKDPKPKTFVVSFPNYSIALTQETIRNDLEFEEHVTVSIFNEMGELVEKAYSWQLEPMGLPSASRFLDKMYEGARRKAMGVDAALDAIMSELPSVSDEEVPF